MSRGASNGFCLAVGVLAERFVRERIELALSNVLRELPVPRRPVKRQKPLSKLRKLLGRQPLYLVLDSFHFAHLPILAPP